MQKKLDDTDVFVGLALQRCPSVPSWSAWCLPVAYKMPTRRTGETSTLIGRSTCNSIGRPKSHIGVSQCWLLRSLFISYIGFSNSGTWNAASAVQLWKIAFVGKSNLHSMWMLYLTEIGLNSRSCLRETRKNEGISNSVKTSIINCVHAIT